MSSEMNDNPPCGRTRSVGFHRGKRILLLGTVMAGAAVGALIVPGATSIASADATTGLGTVGLKVLAPTTGEVVTGPMPITVCATGYRLDSYYAGTAVSNHIGHYHEILDGHLVDMAPLHDPNHDAISMVGASPGGHMLTLVPAYNDHMTVASAAVSIPFTYAGPYLPEPQAGPVRPRWRSRRPPAARPWRERPSP